ncbi:hypothetical protein [Catenulispora rubra]|uniref:hypothetical protein n=1 Tax=Catenulispora rubra TaxID=280293 RepID=UPI00189270E1|nr:hypothetical protein [Catenulispora rubra]
MFRRTLTAVAAVALTVAAVSVIPATTAQARPACSAGVSWCLWSVYQDAAHTVLVGERGYDCSGTWFTTGTQSGYVKFQILPC